MRQRRRERAGDVQQSAPDGEGPASVPRRDPDRAASPPRRRTAYVYLRFEYINAYRILEAAIDEARAAGHLGKNIYGTGFDLDVWLHRGAGAYICGEETGLIESLEGKRGWPRIKPPFPAIEGAFRKPTVVNNVETLCCVPHIIERGADWFKSIGTPKSYGPKLYCVSGHVNKQVCVELPLGVTCRELIDEHAGGVWKGRKAKAAVPGGISMGLLSADELDTPLDFESLRKPGCLGLGTAAVTVIDDQTSIVDYLYNTCRFFAHESCGQCTPCREGTGWMYKMMKRIKAGGGRLEDLDIMLQMANNMGIMPGHDDLRPGRRRRLADQERGRQVPAPSSKSTSGPTRTPGARVTPLQESDRARHAGPTIVAADRRGCRSSRRSPAASGRGDGTRTRPEGTTSRWRPSSSTDRSTRSPRARSSTPSRWRSGSGSTSPTTAGTPRSRWWPTAGCARSRSAARTPRRARSR